MKREADKKWADAIVRRACLLNDRGYGAADIQAHLMDEGHPEIPIYSIRGFIYNRTRIENVGGFNGERKKQEARQA